MIANLISRYNVQYRTVCSHYLSRRLSPHYASTNAYGAKCYF